MKHGEFLWLKRFQEWYIKSPLMQMREQRHIYCSRLEEESGRCFKRPIHPYPPIRTRYSEHPFEAELAAYGGMFAGALSFRCLFTFIPISTESLTDCLEVTTTSGSGKAENQMSTVPGSPRRRAWNPPSWTSLRQAASPFPRSYEPDDTMCKNPMALR